MCEDNGATGLILWRNPIRKDSTTSISSYSAIPRKLASVRFCFTQLPGLLKSKLFFLIYFECQKQSTEPCSLLHTAHQLLLLCCVGIWPNGFVSLMGFGAKMLFSRGYSLDFFGTLYFLLGLLLFYDM